MIRSGLGLVVAVSMVACSGGSEVADAGAIVADAGASSVDSGVADAGAMDAGPVVLPDAGAADAGPPRHYVVDTMVTPVNSAEASAFGLDLDQDGVSDNQFGSIMASLSQSGFDFRGPVADSVSRGTSLTLISVNAAGPVRTFVGQNPRPAACVDLADTVCRRHLDGGTFDVTPGASSDVLFGVLNQGALRTGFDGGQLPLQMAILGAPVMLHLQSARVALTDVTATHIGSGVLAGGITTAERDTVVYPAMVASFAAVVTRDCASPTAPPACGCAAQSSGASVVALFDADHDCQVSLSEVQTSTFLQALFTPDVTVSGVPLLSFGVKISANAATFAE